MKPKLVVIYLNLEIQCICCKVLMLFLQLCLKKEKNSDYIKVP